MEYVRVSGSDLTCNWGGRVAPGGEVAWPQAASAQPTNNTHCDRERLQRWTARCVGASAMQAGNREAHEEGFGPGPLQIVTNGPRRD